MYLCRQSTLVLKVQSYLFVLNFAAFWAYLHFFGVFSGLSYGLLELFYGPLRLLLGRCQVQNQFLELTNEVNQLWFWKYCPIFFVFNSAKFGTLFALLRPFGAIFGVGICISGPGDPLVAHLIPLVHRKSAIYSCEFNSKTEQAQIIIQSYSLNDEPVWH